MLVIRLFGVGKKNQPSFKIVVTEKNRPPRGGRFIEEVGFLNPLKKEKILKKERINYWLSVGAKPSATVLNLLISEKLVEGEKTPKHGKKKKGEEKPAEAKPEAKPEEKKEPEKAAPETKEVKEEKKEEKKETPEAKEEKKEEKQESKEEKKE